jgi:hypothetical protein
VERGLPEVQAEFLAEALPGVGNMNHHIAVAFTKGLWSRFFGIVQQFADRAESLDQGLDEKQVHLVKGLAFDAGGLAGRLPLSLPATITSLSLLPNLTVAARLAQGAKREALAATAAAASPAHPPRERERERERERAAEPQRQKRRERDHSIGREVSRGWDGSYRDGGGRRGGGGGVEWEDQRQPPKSSLSQRPSTPGLPRAPWNRWPLSAQGLDVAAALGALHACNPDATAATGLKVPGMEAIFPTWRAKSHECTHHGPVGHGSAQCTALHPELRRSSDAGGRSRASSLASDSSARG